MHCNETSDERHRSTQMMRFGLSYGAMVRASPHNAVTLLWAEDPTR